MEECVGSILVIALGTAIATNYISLPPTIVSHPITTVLLVLFGIGAFTKYPVLGIAIFLTTAIILFQRNMQATRSVATYGIDSIRRQVHETAAPNAGIASKPREYEQFQETDVHNPMHGPVEGFEPAPYGDAELGENVEGAFPIGAVRTSISGNAMEYAYRPDPDTGSNAFERFGPDMDEKKKSFTY